MTELFDQITTMIDASERDLDRIERTLTDGYAHALTLEGERLRLERRLTELARELNVGDTARRPTSSRRWPSGWTATPAT